MNKSIGGRNVYLKPKLRTYIKLKSELVLEAYLAHGSFLSRSVMFSFRSSSCRLRIETGRRPRKERVCVLCNSGEVENELHFILFCPKYDDLRNLLFSELNEISYGQINLNIRFLSGRGRLGETEQ